MVTTDLSMPSGKTRKDNFAETVLAKIDQYELIRELGGGGFGTVYLAKDTTSGVHVAVKGLPPLVKNNREELENIRENFALVSRLTHTNIAKALVLHPAKEVSYASEDTQQKLRVFADDVLMVMEYAPGITLSKWRKQFPERRVPIPKAIAIVRQIASALDYAHGQRIIHRDIKPANVMIETQSDGKLIARVLDFGLAAEIRSSIGRISREVHDTSGTRPYMAPEQWLGGRQGAATDQYALATLFHELVTGEVPFASVFETGDPMVMQNVIGHNQVELPDDLPASIKSALNKALSKKPSDRFETCADFVDALDGKKPVEPLSIPDHVTQPDNPPPPPPRPFPVGKIAVSIFVMAAIGVGSWLAMSQMMTHRKESTPAPQPIPCPQPIPSPQPTPPQPTSSKPSESDLAPAEKKPKKIETPAKAAQQSADRGSVTAEFIAAYEEKRYDDAARLRHDVDLNNVTVQFDLGHMYANGEGVPKDGDEAVKWYRKAAENGLLAAQFNLGVMYSKGKGIVKDEAESEKWYRKAAEGGYEKAKEVLQKIEKVEKLKIEKHNLEEAKTTLARNTANAISAFKEQRWSDGFQLAQHSDKQNKDIQFFLGVCYDFGYGVLRNETEAVRWYKKAASQGHSTAQANLGGMYANGRGIGKDDSEAFRLFKAAADSGDPHGYCKLGEAYEKGIGTPQNDAMAIRYYSKAAAAGMPEGMQKLALARNNMMMFTEVVSSAYEYLTEFVQQQFLDHNEILSLSEELKQQLTKEIAIREELLPTAPLPEVAKQNLTTRRMWLQDVIRINNKARSLMGLR